MASAVQAYVQAFGSDAPPPTYDDIPDAETHVIWGANPKIAHPVLYRRIADSAGGDDGELIVVDPVESETAADADLHVSPEPGTDLALARAVLAQVVDDGLVDPSSSNTTPRGSRPWSDRCQTSTSRPRPPVSGRARLRAGRGVRRSDPRVLGNGGQPERSGTGTARSLIDLCLATGNLGPGSGPFSLTGQANSMGNRVCASKSSWPGYRPFDDTAHRKAIANAWGVPAETGFPTRPGRGSSGSSTSWRGTTSTSAGRWRRTRSRGCPTRTTSRAPSKTRS